jgi:hypothetical protein
MAGPASYASLVRPKEKRSQALLQVLFTAGSSGAAKHAGKDYVAAGRAVELLSRYIVVRKKLPSL